MAFPRITDDLEVITGLPNTMRGSGYNAAQVKAFFDAAAGSIKTFLNYVLIPALDACGLVITGEYDAETEYAANTVFTYQGSVYVTLQEVDGVTPTNDEENYLLLFPGITSIARTSGNGSAGTADTYTITLANGDTHTFDVTNGADGAPGNGIASITRTSGDGSAGSTDTYTITYTDATTTTFTVVNGSDGSGVPAGGTTGQVLRKKSATDNDTEWANAYVPDTVSQADAEAGTSTTVYSWTPQRVAQAIAELAIGSVLGQITSYTGTGSYGSENPNEITCNFDPGYVLIKQRHTSQPYYRLEVMGVTALSSTNVTYNATYNATATMVMTYTSATKTLSWYNASAANAQLNNGGTTYDVVLKGVAT